MEYNSGLGNVSDKLIEDGQVSPKLQGKRFGLWNLGKGVWLGSLSPPQALPQKGTQLI